MSKQLSLFVSDDEDIKDDFQISLNDKVDIKIGDIFQLGEHRLMCGDSTIKEHVDILMDGNKADMCFTDPPYGVDYKGIKNDDKKGLENLLNLSFDNMKKNSNFGVSVYCFHSDKNADIFNKIFRKYCYFSSMIIWKKSMTLSFSDYHSSHEPCLYGWFNNGTHNYYGDRKQTTIWEYDKPLLVNHTTPKPIEFIIKAIKNSSKKGDIILDLFGGSGSTLIAAEITNRKCYMMEIDPQYVDVIIRRYEYTFGKKAVKLNDI